MPYADPSAHREVTRRNVKRSRDKFNQRRKDSPALNEVHLAKRRRYQKAVLADPVKLKKHAEYQAAYHRADREGNAQLWLRRALSRVKCRCKPLGIPFDLAAEDLVMPTTCPVLGIPIIVGPRTDNAPSVDRIFPHLGYVRGNVEIISWLANRIKNDCTDPVVFRALAAYLERHK